MFALPLASLPGPLLGFGDGYGLSMPFWDNRFYWLHDAKTKRAAWYSPFFGLGAQLHSIEFHKPEPGEERELFGHTFHVFQTGSHRRGFTVMTAWELDGGVKDMVQVRELLRELEQWRG